MSAASDQQHLLYFADPMCSWCWGFAPVIRQLHEELGAQLPIRVIAGGLRAGETRPLTDDKRAMILHHWHQVQAASGQPFGIENALPDGFVYDTEPACRAVSLAAAESSALALQVLHALQDAFYAQSKPVNTEAGVQDCLRESGWAALAEAHGSDEARDLAQQDFDRSRDHGISGFPSLLLSTPTASGPKKRMVCVGYQALTEARAAVQRAVQRDR